MREPDQDHQNIDGRLVLARCGFGQGRSRLFLRRGFGLALPVLARSAPMMAPDFLPLPVLLGAAQHGQERQSPDAAGPRQAHQNHHREPFQAVAFNNQLVARSDWVAITTYAFDLPTAPALDRVISANDDGARRERDDQAEQNLGGEQGIPLSAIEDPMVVLKMLLITQADYAQTGRDRAFASLKQSPKQERFSVFPSRLGKLRLENYNQIQQLGRQCRHTEDLSWRRFLPQLTRPALIFSKSKNG